jgi:hypothetical protein
MSNRNSSAGDGPGLTNGRQWAALPLSGGPIEWSVTADQGYVQGPLDLEFLRGQKLSLLLSERQQALLVQDGQLRAVYLDGAHYLEIGLGERQIPPSCQLIFLALEDSLQLRWPRTAPLRWGPDPDQTLIGSCSLGIEWPGRFFGTFLQGQAQPDPDFILRLIDQMVRGLFEELLTVGVDSETTAGAYELQARLTRLSPADLNDELNACGLNCTRLAVYTAAPPVEEQDRIQTPKLAPVRKP